MGGCGQPLHACGQSVAGLVLAHVTSGAACGTGSRSSVVLITITDMIGPDACSAAGRQLENNMALLREARCPSQVLLRQGVSPRSTSQDLIDATKVFLVGSPASHDPLNVPCLDILNMRRTGSVRFKLDVFHSMCWHTRRAFPATWSGGPSSRSTRRGFSCWLLPEPPGYL